eukprot:CAMPEP_0116838826 /NCGR_PEP_ID=MMETSP0418-20121206/9429_1 /TAXON_ID=1158023 /ORGANISM="Astrosyne radiata, Strain 13vi08-1A" /LENGTH=403 /DNA_ID=CAMNT_0004468873 /DNA_START=75 /DNA_END=1287 /DNA_ORIENTATION=-
MAFQNDDDDDKGCIVSSSHNNKKIVSNDDLCISGFTDNQLKYFGENGCGVPVVGVGGLKLYDPDEQGRLAGSGTLQKRIAQGSSYEYETVAEEEEGPWDAQDWLEDIGVPTNFARNSAPVQATVLGRTRLIGSDAPGDIQHVLMQLPEGMHYVEGQSISVIPPGTNAKTNKPHAPRLYSIASTRYGDLLDGRTVGLCVRRAEYTDPITGIVDLSKAGVCSNFLCDAMPGQKVSVAGPVGKTMLLPEDRNADIIMVATGTGIAPFRGFLHRLFMERTTHRHMFTGTAWLILGVPVSSGLLYKTEIDAMQQNALPGQLEVDYAISREMTNSMDGGKLYVQHVLAEKADILLQRLEGGAHIYFCGLKGMMSGVFESLRQVCASRGMDFALKLKEWQSKNQWHVEVY